MMPYGTSGVFFRTIGMLRYLCFRGGEGKEGEGSEKDEVMGGKERERFWSGMSKKSKYVKGMEK